MRICLPTMSHRCKSCYAKRTIAHGYAVAVCPDGLTAIAALEKSEFDCLLVDLDMPGKNGMEVIQRAKELYPDIEAIIMTVRPTTQTPSMATNMMSSLT